MAGKGSNGTNALSENFGPTQETQDQLESFFFFLFNHRYVTIVCRIGFAISRVTSEKMRLNILLSKDGTVLGRSFAASLRILLCVN